MHHQHRELAFISGITRQPQAAAAGGRHRPAARGTSMHQQASPATSRHQQASAGNGMHPPAATGIGRRHHAASCSRQPQAAAAPPVEAALTAGTLVAAADGTIAVVPTATSTTTEAKASTSTGTTPSIGSRDAVFVAAVDPHNTIDGAQWRFCARRPPEFPRRRQRPSRGPPPRPHTEPAALGLGAIGPAHQEAGAPHPCRGATPQH